MLLPYGSVAVTSKNQKYIFFEVQPHTPTIFYAFIQKNVNFINNNKRGKEIAAWQLWYF